MSNPLQYAHAIFCDEVRTENNGKAIYIGIYNGSMLLNNDTPTLLPQLTVVATYVETKGAFDAPIMFKLSATWQEAPIIEIDVINGPRPYVQPTRFPYGGEPLTQLQILIPITQFMIPSEGRLSANFVCGEQVVKAGSLEILISDQATAAAPLRPEPVKLAGATYTFGGLPIGMALPWSMIQKDGLPLQEGEFVKLPEAEQEILSKQVAAYLGSLQVRT